MSGQKDKLAAKKAALSVKGNRKIVSAIMGAVLVISAIAGLLIFSKSGRSPSAAVSETSGKSAAHIMYPVSMFDDGTAQHFQYNHGSTLIRYFVLKSSDGVIRSAFDACDVCWPSGKGYYQDGDHMICANCGKRFSSILINEVKGGCNPEPLGRKISGDNLIIRVEDILAGKKYFDFR